jgi:hypothetical protein
MAKKKKKKCSCSELGSVVQVQQTQGTSIEKKVFYYTLALLAVGGTGLAIRHFIRKQQNQNMNRRAFDEGDPANFASHFEDAIYGMGTDEDKIFETIQAIPTQAFYNRVEQAYKALTGSELTTDLKGDLSNSEMERFEAIKRSKPFR